MNWNVVEYYSVTEMNYWYMSQQYAKWKPHQCKVTEKITLLNDFIYMKL